jgi:hypothetical protein
LKEKAKLMGMSPYDSPKRKSPDLVGPLKKLLAKEKTKSSPVRVNFGSTARKSVYAVQVPFNPDAYADK